MAAHASLPDDKSLWDMAMLGTLGGPALLVAHDLGFFPLLAERPRTLLEFCEHTKLPLRPTEAILGLLAAQKLVTVGTDGAYALTSVAATYLLPTSPMYFGGFLSMAAAVFPMYSFESLKRVASTGAPVMAGTEGGDVFELSAQQAEMAVAVTRAMQGMSVAPASVWPSRLDLSAAKTLLDLGGGSGVHSIAAAKKWPQLNAVLLDLAPVCKVADEFIAAAGLQARVTTVAGDLWKGALPVADVHFYGSVFHDWPEAKCLALAKRSFDALPAGGRIVLHEMLLDDDKAGPGTVAAFSVSMLFGTHGKQYSGRELSAVLAQAGFGAIQVTPTFGYWSVVTGTK